MASSSIEWTQLTWNPTTGCDKVSAGCKFCYAEVMSRRLKAMGAAKYIDGFNIREHEAALAVPYRWRKPAMVFVNSMSDLFHESVSVQFIQRTFEVMENNPHLIFQVLTKRSARLAEIWRELPWSENVWIGVSVEDERVKNRINDLRQVPAAVRFLSCEPLIGPLSKLNLRGIDWVIVGGESGTRPRPMLPEWVKDIRDQCDHSDVAFFFKQWGGRNKKAAGRELDGLLHDKFPQPKLRRRSEVISP
ncbi:MAG: phage Gp37/Gp68 family protein [Verrucomicrobiaceae bacterium]|nr:MAG: phage Gp37/Gp68 family protein [Verrucomicrobiaceae bacterium]